MFGPMRSRLVGVCAGAISALALIGAMADGAAAAILVAGDQVALTAIEETPNAGAAFPVQLTVGPYSGTGQLFDISSLSVFNGAGQCISCGWQLNLGNLFIDEGIMELSGSLSGTLNTGQKTDYWLRWTACFRKINGKWLIVHHQNSVPVDLQTGRAVLSLKP